MLVESGADTNVSVAGFTPLTIAKACGFLLVFFFCHILHLLCWLVFSEKSFFCRNKAVFKYFCGRKSTKNSKNLWVIKNTCIKIIFS